MVIRIASTYATTAFPNIPLMPTNPPKLAPLILADVHVVPHVSDAPPKLTHERVVGDVPDVLDVPNGPVWALASPAILTNKFHVPSDDLCFTSTWIPLIMEPLGIENPYPKWSIVRQLLAPSPVNVAKAPSSAVAFPGFVQRSVFDGLFCAVVQRFGPAVLMGTATSKARSARSNRPR